MIKFIGNLHSIKRDRENEVTIVLKAPANQMNEAMKIPAEVNLFIGVEIMPNETIGKINE